MSVYIYSIIIFCCSQCDILGRFCKEYFFLDSLYDFVYNKVFYFINLVYFINHFPSNKLEKVEENFIYFEITFLN